MPAMRHRWSTDQVRALIDESRPWPRYELLGGELIVTPAPGSAHQFAVIEICVRLAAYCDGQDLGAALVSPADLELHPGTIAQPDVFVVPLAAHENPDQARGWSMVNRLLLAVEIVSLSSARTDRALKRDHYLSAGVPEYWVVDLDARMVERWSPERETPVVLRTTLEWSPAGASEPLTIDLKQMFDSIWRKFRRLGGE